jgi:hypothetical protein
LPLAAWAPPGPSTSRASAASRGPGGRLCSMRAGPGRFLDPGASPVVAVARRGAVDVWSPRAGSDLLGIAHSIVVDALPRRFLAAPAASVLTLLLDDGVRIWSVHEAGVCATGGCVAAVPAVQGGGWQDATQLVLGSADGSIWRLDARVSSTEPTRWAGLPDCGQPWTAWTVAGSRDEGLVHAMSPDGYLAAVDMRNPSAWFCAGPVPGLSLHAAGLAPPWLAIAPGNPHLVAAGGGRLAEVALVDTRSAPAPQPLFMHAGHAVGQHAVLAGLWHPTHAGMLITADSDANVHMWAPAPGVGSAGE